MAKKFFLLLCVFLSSYQSDAQKGSNYISIGPSAGFPMNFDNTHKTGFGAGLRGYFGAGPGSILINLNALSFENKFYPNRDLNLISIKIGYASRLNPPGLFGYFDAGITTYSVTGRYVMPGVGFGLGYGIPVRNGGAIDIVPNFNVAFHNNNDVKRTWIDLHVAYRFGISGR